MGSWCQSGTLIAGGHEGGEMLTSAGSREVGQGTEREAAAGNKSLSSLLVSQGAPPSHQDPSPNGTFSYDLIYGLTH